MTLANCTRCKQLFIKEEESICKSCIKREDEDFERTRHFLEETPGASLADIAKELEIKEKIIRNWIRKGRLEVTGFANLSVSCDACGKPIDEGRYCKTCVTKLASGLQASIGEQDKIFKSKKSNKSRMHITKHTRNPK